MAQVETCDNRSCKTGEIYDVITKKCTYDYVTLSDGNCYGVNSIERWIDSGMRQFPNEPGMNLTDDDRDIIQRAVDLKKYNEPMVMAKRFIGEDVMPFMNRGERESCSIS